jgi:molybdopterin molybdotransferase
MPHDLLSFDDALPHFRQAMAACDSVSVPLSQSIARILAQPIAMPKPQPPFDRATMDGYAVAPLPAQPGGPYQILGTVPAGDHTDWNLQAGEAVRIMTGARAPAGTAVVPIEVCQLDDTPQAAGVQVPEELASVGKNIALAGEDAAAGAPIGHPGAIIDAALVAALATTGADTVLTYEPPHVSLITTGNEVGGEGATSIANSNGPLLLGLCAGWQLPTTYQHCPDDQNTLQKLFSQQKSHLIITTGGVSAGDHDYIPAASQQAGFTFILHGIAMQPGKPVYLAKHDDGRVHLGLPGNPVSVLATAQLLMGELLAGCWPGFALPTLRLPLTAPCAAKRRRLFLPARLVDGGVEPVRWHGSGDLFAASAADGLIDLAAQTQYETGTLVTWHPYCHHQPGSRLRMSRFGDDA